MPQVTWQPGNDYVIVGREDVLTAPFRSSRPNCHDGSRRTR